MNNIKSKPLLFSFIAILIFISLHSIPLSKLFSHYGFNEHGSKSYDTIITNFTLIIGIYFLLKKSNIPFKLFSFSFRNFKYYLPLLFYVFVFSGGLGSFRDFDFASININTFFLYTFKYFSSSFLEEFLFRGLILGLFLVKYINTKNGILKSVVFSSLLFGFAHIMNFWTIEGRTLEGVLNQVYATACFGVMYGATYLKTRSILTLGLIHFISNFFAAIQELEITDVANYTNAIIASDKTFIIIIINKLLTLFIFGIPLIIGLYLIFYTNKEDLNKLTLKIKTE